MKILPLFFAVPLLRAATAADWGIESSIESPQVNGNTTMKTGGK